MPLPNVFDHEDYRDYLRNRIKAMPSQGHGQLAKIAKHLRVHPTLLTQILKGTKNLHLEHGVQIAEYFGMNELENEFFLSLIELERAGHFKLKSRIKSRMNSLREQHRRPQARIPKHSVLSESDRAVFYSNWFYSAVRLGAALPDLQSIDKLAEALKLDRKTTQEALDFLLRTGLVSQENGKTRLGPQRTYLSESSLLVQRHHANWRLKAIERHQALSASELAFTAPISISQKDFAIARKILVGAIEEISELVDKSKEESVACINMDLFFVSKT